MTNCTAVRGAPRGAPRKIEGDRCVPYGVSIPLKLADALDAEARALGQSRTDYVLTIFRARTAARPNRK
ncbi:MAG: hypothetical protein IKS15_05670 [Opitutales bacterium]|nr:hypothetical protein [Opitutales bacterium]